VGSGASSLTADNGGAILFNNQAFLLANVGINIPPGNPILPATLIASPALTLYGQPWHSYWIEERDTRSDLNPWVYGARIPLTNSFQAFAPAPPPNLDTPSKTNQLFSTTSLAAGTTWQPGVVTKMTNAFRIMAPMPATDPKRFFRAKRL
jgi:hypothetical protein